MSLALYRKYRSRSLDEIVGQSHVTELLAEAIKQDRVAHAYLFTGPRGTGKTSIARILAHQINGLPYDSEATNLDIIEIDAASNNGVDDIRDLRDKVQIAPVSSKKKVYIIDEVHMLSKPAFNALLKTLEEPPEHVVFILATTDIDKVPPTILSRTQRHTFKRASEDDIVANLTRIAKAESIKVDSDALQLIAAHSDGSFRDSVSLFDQLANTIAGEPVTSETVQRSLGLAGNDSLERLLTAAKRGDINVVSDSLSEFEANGTSARIVAQQLMRAIRKRLATEPDFLPLLDQLLDVTKSPYPELKLLTILSLHSVPLTAPVSSAVSKLHVTKSTAPPPSLRAAKQPPASPAEPAADSAPTKPTSPRAKSKSAEPFDWNGFIEYVRSNYVALYSVLSKCEPLLEDGTLTLYTKSQFYKKKLDDAKYRGLLNESLEHLGYDLAIETLPTAIPLKDSQAARVAAMMGGGEEVSLEDPS